MLSGLVGRGEEGKKEEDRVEGVRIIICPSLSFALTNTLTITAQGRKEVSIWLTIPSFQKSQALEPKQLVTGQPRSRTRE